MFFFRDACFQKTRITTRIMMRDACNIFTLSANEGDTNSYFYGIQKAL